MRRDDYLFKLQQRMIRRWWLLLKYIEGRARDLARNNCIMERGFVYQSSARAVDDARPGFHFGKSLSVDQSAGLGRKRRMNRQKVCARKHFIQSRRFNFDITGLIDGNERIVRDDFHSQACRSLRDRAANSSQADYSQSLAAQFCADEFLSLPF